MERKAKILRLMLGSSIGWIAAAIWAFMISRDAAILGLIMTGCCFLVAYGWRELEYMEGEE